MIKILQSLGVLVLMFLPVLLAALIWVVTGPESFIEKLLIICIGLFILGPAQIITGMIGLAVLQEIHD